MIEIIELIKTRLPQGFSLSSNVDTYYKKIRYKDWDKDLHYEILEQKSLNVEIHLESDKLKHLVDIIKPFIEKIKITEEFKQSEDVKWDPLWYVNNKKSGGSGRLIVSFPKTTFPSIIVEAMLKLIDMTFDDINDNLLENTLNERDKTKYKFENQIYNKRNLVFAIINDFVSKKPNINYQELEEIFPKNIQGSNGVFKEKNQVTDNNKSRYFIENSINLADSEIVVCNQWGKPNITRFIIKIKELGYEVEEIIENIDKNNIINESERSTMPTKSHPLNIILYGPPGTGKTYNSINYAVSIIENKDIKEIELESEADRAKIEKRFNDYREKGQIEFITFHQNYSYEDFIQGLKPDIENNSQLSFTRKDGIFKTISERAIKGSNFQDVYETFIETFQTLPNNILTLKTKTHGKDFTVKLNSKGNFVAQPNTATATEMVITKEALENYLTNAIVSDWKPYLIPISEYMRDNFDLQIHDNSKKQFVIIIDEINRANISRVFGELITLIEPDKRETLKVTLPSGEIFTVPKNLYIIGTMNTADKSIALLDIALRRRFKFIGKYTDYSKISDFKEYLKPINDEIKKRKKSADFMIGHSYFINKNLSDLTEIFNNEIIPLLNEYFNNKTDVVEEILKSSQLNYEIDEDTFQITVKEP